MTTTPMSRVVAIIKPFRAMALLEALTALPIAGLEVLEARGHGRQKDRLDRYQGSEFSRAALPKIRIAVLVAAEHLEMVLQTIQRVARTGRIGDGKIFVVPVEAIFF
jgi:nitrogen regulatory protein P-II 2